MKRSRSSVTPSLHTTLKQYLDQLIQPETSEEVLKSIKTIVRNDTSVATPILISLIKSHIHMSSFSAYRLQQVLLLVETLVTRSVLFRRTILDHLQSIIAPLFPIPKKTSSTDELDQLQDTLLLFLRSMHRHYSKTSPKFRLLCESLEQAGYKFPKFDAEEQARRKKARTNQLMKAKFDQFEQDFSREEDEMLQELKKIKSCYELLVPNVEDIFAQNPVSPSLVSTSFHDTFDEASEDEDSDSIEWEDATEDERVASPEPDAMSVVSNGLGSVAYHLEIEIPTSEKATKTRDNEILFQQLEDSLRLVQKRYLPRVHQWYEFLACYNQQVEVVENLSRAYTRRIDELQSQLKNVLHQWEELVQNKAHHIITRSSNTPCSVSTRDFVATFQPEKPSTSRKKRARIPPNPKNHSKPNSKSCRLRRH